MPVKEEYLLLLNDRSKLYPKIKAMEPLLPQCVSAAVNIVPAHIKGQYRLYAVAMMVVYNAELTLVVVYGVTSVHLSQCPVYPSQ